MKPVLSPKDLAQAIGVSESSVKRWVDDGTIEASRTSGGHRRIAIGEAIRFIRQSGTPLVHPEILGLVDVQRANEEPETGASDEDQLYHFLHEGKAAEARGFVLRLYLAGESVASICDGPLQSAMAKMGELWHNDPDGILLEHRATDICLQALAQLRLTVDTPGDADRPLAIGCAPSGDPYLLPSWSVATALMGDGYRVLNLGPETPAATFQLAVDRFRPRITWLSVSHLPEPEKRLREWTPVVQKLAKSQVHLVLGGRLRKKLGLPTSPFTFVAGTLSELSALVRGFAAAS